MTLTRELGRWILAAFRASGWAPAAVFLVHVGLSSLGAYLAAPGLDVPMHALGGAAIAFFFLRALDFDTATPLIGALTPLGRSLFALTATCAAAVLWEFAEWTTDRLGWTEAQLGLDDTMLDLAVGIVGGVIVLTLASARRRPSR